MTPTQIQGLWLCLCLSLLMMALVPTLWWVLPDTYPPG
jgi:hypothetical protein